MIEYCDYCDSHCPLATVHACAQADLMSPWNGFELLNCRFDFLSRRAQKVC